MAERFTRFGYSIACIAVLSLRSCDFVTSEEDRISQKVASKVESMPGTSSLGEYSQYYARGKDGLIEAVFIINDNDLRGGFRQMVEESCVRDKRQEYPCDQPDFGVIEPGEIRWLRRVDQLPGRDGGGCSYVRISYDPSADRFLAAKCNGSY